MCVPIALVDFNTVELKTNLNVQAYGKNIFILVYFNGDYYK